MPNTFDLIHSILWETLMIIATIWLWLNWTKSINFKSNNVLIPQFLMKSAFSDDLINRYAMMGIEYTPSP